MIIIFFFATERILRGLAKTIDDHLIDLTDWLIAYNFCFPPKKLVKYDFFDDFDFFWRSDDYKKGADNEIYKDNNRVRNVKTLHVQRNEKRLQRKIQTGSDTPFISLLFTCLVRPILLFELRLLQFMNSLILDDTNYFMNRRLYQIN